MPMNGATMGLAIKAGVTGVSTSGLDLNDPDDFANYQDAVFEAIGNAIVTHIQTNATVSTSVAVTSVSAVQPGAGVSGPGTGSGSGTIS